MADSGTVKELTKVRGDAELLERRCRQGVLRFSEVGDALKSLEARVRATLGDDSDAARHFDRCRRDATDWWSESLSGYVNRGDCDNIGRFLTTLRGTLDLLEPGSPGATARRKDQVQVRKREKSRNEEEGPSVFLCYASEWLQVVRTLYRQLREAGCRPWMDKEDLAVGEHWERAIPRAIRDSDFFLACVSHQFNERGFLQREIKVALDVLKEIPSGQVFVLPIVLEPSCRVPEELQHAQWDEYFRPGGIGRLLTAISQHSGCELRIPPPYATWPQTPVDIDEFSPKLVSEIDRVAGDFSSSLLRRLHEAEAEEAIPGRKALEALARGVKPSQELDIEISCIDDQGVFRVHPWRGVVGSDVEAEWTEAKGSAFVDWLRNRLRSEWSGHLTWTDTLASDPRLEGQVQAESLDYERRTVVSFSNVPVVGDRAWTVCIEGHEVVRLRRGDRPKA